MIYCSTIGKGVSNGTSLSFSVFRLLPVGLLDPSEQATEELVFKKIRDKPKFSHLSVPRTTQGTNEKFFFPSFGYGSLKSNRCTSQIIFAPSGEYLFVPVVIEFCKKKMRNTQKVGPSGTFAQTWGVDKERSGVVLPEYRAHDPLLSWTLDRIEILQPHFFFCIGQKEYCKD